MTSSASRTTPKPAGLVLGRATLAPSGVPSWISPRGTTADPGQALVRRVQSVAAPELNPYAEAGHHQVSHAHGEPPREHPEEAPHEAETRAPMPVALEESVMPQAMQVPLAPVMPAMSELPDGVEVSALRDENRRLHDRLAQMEFALPSARAEVLRGAEMEVVRLAVALAERVIAREVRTDRGLVAKWARAALDALHDEGVTVSDAVVAVGADAPITAAPDAWKQHLDGHARVETDPRLPADGVEVRAGGASVDVSTRGRWDSVRADLLGTEEP